MNVNHIAADNSAGIVAPNYLARDLKIGVMHFGPSNFSRAHLFRIIDEYINKSGDMSWGIMAVSTTASQTFQNLRSELIAQDNRYAVVETNHTRKNVRVVGSIKEMVDARHETDRVIAQFADPALKMVSMTVTPSGYYAASGGLNLADDNVKECLESKTPKTVIGMIAHGLIARQKAALTEKLSVVSCDNLPNNGAILGNAVKIYVTNMALPQEDRKSILHWISDNINFPNTMVDRIVPDPKKTDVQHVLEMSAIQDSCPIYTEQFKQFVVEDLGDIKLTPLESVGVIFTDNILAHENTKLRILNGAHMALGVLGGLMDIKNVDEAMSNPQISGFADEFMDDMAFSLRGYSRIDVPQYCVDTKERLENPNMQDQCTRLTRQLSEKFPKRIFPALRQNLAQGVKPDALIFLTASWLHYAKNNINDPVKLNDEYLYKVNADNVLSCLNGDPSMMLNFDGIFGSDLPADPYFPKQLKAYYADIADNGIEVALKNFNNAPQVKLNVFSQNGIANDNLPNNQYQPMKLKN